MKGSYIQQIKRGAMKACGVKFADRMREAVRTGTKVADVVFEKQGKTIIAKSKP